MSTMYEIAILGEVSEPQVAELRRHVEELLAPFELVLGDQVAWSVGQDVFPASRKHGAVAVFFGGAAAKNVDVRRLLRAAIPVLPVASSVRAVADEIPDALRPL